VLDEAGARVHISNIHVPEDILELEAKVEKVKLEKIQVVKSQNYEEAARLRDTEKNLLKQLEEAKQNWEESSKNNKYVVGEEDVAEVIAMITGIPVKRIAQGEGKKLLNMESDLQKRVIGQDAAIAKLSRAIQRTRAGLKDPN